MANDPPLHVVLGAGQVGAQVIEKLVHRGARVRVVRRSDRASVPGTAQLAGDLRDPAFADEAMRSAAVVYQCAAPPYERWLADFLDVHRGILHGATRAGARLVYLDNVYMYGLDDRRIRAAFDLRPTPLDEAVATTARWAREAYGVIP